MSSFTQISRLSNYILGTYKTVLHTRRNWLNTVQVCNYTKKSAEEKLGIEKPKRPLTSFFKFMTQMRPALLAKNPGITSKEAIAWTSKHWQQLDTCLSPLLNISLSIKTPFKAVVAYMEDLSIPSILLGRHICECSKTLALTELITTKNQMLKEYEKDFEDYKKIKEIYEASLTEQQKEDIIRVKAEMSAAKEKRKLKTEFKEMGKPKKPMSSYFLYIQTRKDIFQGNQMKEYQEKIKADWLKLSESERTKYEKQAQALMDKYKKDLEAWEIKMIAIGRTDLVRQKHVRLTKKRNIVKVQ